MQRVAIKSTKNTLSTSARSVAVTLIAGGFLAISVLFLIGCASVDMRVGSATEVGSIAELQTEWDELEGRVGTPNKEFRKQYAKSLQTLNNVIAEKDQYKEAVEWSRH